MNHLAPIRSRSHWPQCWWRKVRGLPWPRATSRSQLPSRRSTSRLHVESLEPRVVLAGDSLVISEFMASNANTLADIDGDFSDWIEIYNPTNADVNFKGWHLTDDATNLSKWTFPDVTLAADDYFIVFASDKDRIDATSELHANFKLTASGEYLALVNPQLDVESDFGLAYPEQSAGVSYGLVTSFVDARTYEFLAMPTPGQANSGNAIQYLASVEPSHLSGFYDAPFQLTLSSPDANAVIRYTTDGNPPTIAEGTIYSGPISVDGSTIIKAQAFRLGFQARSVTVRSYLFLDDVVSQSNASVIAQGFPSTWGERIADYAMDPNVIGGPGVDHFDGKYAATIKDDLLAIPSLSLVVDPDQFFGSRGIYANPDRRGINFEKAVSGELIDSQASEHIQFDAGIRIQGGISRDVGVKQSLRIVFRSRYGAATLNDPLFGENGANRFDSISLRSSSGESFAGTHYIRDTFARQSQLATGNFSARGRFLHVYINGVYWGVYEAVERPDAQFAANYYGGSKVDWDVINAGDLGNEQDTAINGNLMAWQELVSLADSLTRPNPSVTVEHDTYMRILGLNPDGTDNPNYETLLDVDNYVDYLITNIFLSNNDWPYRNFYMARQRGPESTGFKFFVWDAEFTLDPANSVSIQSLLRLNETLGPSQILNGLSRSEDFLVRFSDRVQMHFSPGGAFYVDSSSPVYNPDKPSANVPTARYDAIAQSFRSPLVAESARWGDGISTLTDSLLTPDEGWLAQVRAHFVFFSKRSEQVLTSLRRASFYRSAPKFSRLGGVVQPTDELRFTNVGTTYYTLDGSDPRLPDGTVSAAAMTYSDPIPLSRSVRVAARTFDGGFWSAVDTRTYLTLGQPDATSLRISEVHYHPAEPADLAPGFASNDFEFIELINTADVSIDLAGAKLIRVDTVNGSEGVDFAFDQANSAQLGPGQRIVIVENVEAFQSRYGADVPIFGQWNGRLNDSGELLTLTVNGLVVQQFGYDDGWYSSTNGGGTSLEIVNPWATDLNLWSTVAGWQPSGTIGGTPGTGSVPVAVLPGDFDGNGVVNAADMDLLLKETNTNDVGIAGNFDLTEDGLVDSDDVRELLINILGTRPGDANLDGRVDASDLNTLGQHWLSDEALTDMPLGWADGDFDGDGRVNATDLNLLGQNWQYGVPVPARAFAELAELPNRQVARAAARELISRRGLGDAAPSDIATKTDLAIVSLVRDCDKPYR